MAQIRVRNTPSPRLMATIGATNQSTPEAIGELVANSFDARFDNERLDIYIDMRGNSISVIDDGQGMTEAILEKAICIAEDMSKHLTRNKGAKGHFGMGLKTSCATLGRYYEIYTRPVNEDREYHVAFDISEYAKRASGEDAWDVLIDYSRPLVNGPLGTRAHGTAVVISRLREEGTSVSAVLNYLGEAFKGHLKTGDSITILDVTGEHAASPKKESLIPGTRIDIDTSCGPNGSYHITGWVGLDKQTHNDGNYGFNIYRHEQLVEKWDKSWFRAHLMTSRIIGEVEMNFLDATFYKQGLQQSDVWKIVKAHMTEYLKGVVKASNAVSKQHNISKPSELKKIVSELRDSYEEPKYEYDYKEFGSARAKTRQGDGKPSVHNSVQNVITEHALHLKDGEHAKTINITYLEKTLSGGVKAPFDYIFDPSYEEDEPSELQVILYRDHPLWEKSKTDSEIVKVLATSDAIYRVLVEELNYDTSKALKIRNEWVWARTNGESD